LSYRGTGKGVYHAADWKMKMGFEQIGVICTAHN
jgi:hypothetical protein